ncbi:uncharacterized protein FPRO_15707 [Fusarium proliferatum ET1]|uniref:Uncharacterized protein n=1 Tax=Fusarium proliferatum (strain ET1) TaxID=1227346 RepID=A0A1L7VXF2_FUSPR|nr:uncharacterized protein FPRO_15707 [Fusarium proliferatum ET1]CZR45118.1 uncharacterized protein FPRO_15707 [Fusarium proliferatum ET1]
MNGQPSIRPEQGSYVQFQVATSQPITSYNRKKDVLAKLRDSIPQNETQWQQAREFHGYSTAESVLQKTRTYWKTESQRQICGTSYQSHLVVLIGIWGANKRLTKTSR